MGAKNDDCLNVAVFVRIVWRRETKNVLGNRIDSAPMLRFDVFI